MSADRPRRADADRASLGRLAHELRTPLAAIQSMADALAGGHLGPLSDRRHVAYLESIRDTARHALEVVDGMVSGLGRDGAGGAARQTERAPLDLGAIAGEVVASLRTLAARAGIELAVATDAGPLAAAHATDVRQMLINLVANAIAHTGAGSRVRLSSGTGAPGEVWLEVADDGPGIPADVLARIAGSSAATAADGLDGRDERERLGLAVTRSLAAASGGRLELASDASGTRARIVLPAERA